MGEFLFPIQAEGAASPFAWRQYQIDAVANAADALQTSGGCLLILPCGCGKTEIAVRLINEASPTGRAIVITPFVNLVGQTASRLRLRGVSCGVEQATLRSHEPVTVASYKSLISRDRYQRFLDEGIDLVIVDESHLNYSRRALEILTAFRNGGARIVGMTASPDRTSGDPLTAFYGGIAFNYTLQQAIADGWLVPPKIWIVVAGDLDLSKFDSGFGDFDAARVAEVMAQEGNVQTVTNLVLQHHEGEPSVVFCQGIMQAEKVRECLWRAGVLASIVHSGMDEDERRMNLHEFESGKTNIVINVGCLTTGWDCCNVRKLFMCRPTRSRMLYQQMVGRGTRPLTNVVDGYSTAALRRRAIASSAKPDFEVFDLVDCSRHNDLMTCVEALNDDLPADVAKRVRQKREGESGLPLTELGGIIEAAQEDLRREAAEEAQRRAALDYLTADQRAGLNAEQSFGNFGREAFASAEGVAKPKPYRGWRWLWGQHKGKPLPEMDVGYMQWALAKCNLKEPFRSAVKREVERRLELVRRNKHRW
jgi:superfamily II DNA or RNA helicase